MASKQETENASQEDSDGGSLNGLLNQMQNIDLKSDSQQQEFNEREKIIIPDWLKHCESPFLWHSKEVRGLGVEFVIQRSLEKLLELDLEEPDFSLQRFVSLLKLVLEYHVIDDMEKSWSTMKTIEDLLEKEASGDNSFYQRVKLCLRHVVTTTKAHLLFLAGEEENSRKIGQNVIPVKVMDNQNQAALCVMKARFFLYSGYENGESLGVAFARKALEFEPENGEWEYLLAKMLRQQRRNVPFSMDIPREELTLMERAVARSRNAKHLVYLAQVFRESAKQAFIKYRNNEGFYSSSLFSTMKDMCSKSLNHYKEALELEPDSPATLRRCGYGIMNLPKNVADYELALQCLLRSQKILDNQNTMHILGTFYHRYGNDDKKALEYFETLAKAGNHAGLCDMIRVKYFLDPEYDPCEDLESGMNCDIKRNNRILFLVQLIGYFLFIKRDFHTSVEYCKQVIVEDKDSVHMKIFKSFFLRMNQTINLFEYLANEALLLLQEKSNITLDKPEEENKFFRIKLEYVEDFIYQISEIHPEFMEITPDPLLIDELLQSSQEIIKADKLNRLRSFHKNHRGTGNRGAASRGGNAKRGYGSRGGAAKWNSYSGRKDYSNEIEDFSEDYSERRGRYSRANQRKTYSSNNYPNRRGGFSRAQERDEGQSNEREDDFSEDYSERRGRYSIANQRNTYSSDDYPNRRGGFYRAQERDEDQSNEREHFSEDYSERRGRYSIANQRNTYSSDDYPNRRGGFSRAQERVEDQSNEREDFSEDYSERRGRYSRANKKNTYSSNEYRNGRGEYSRAQEIDKDENEYRQPRSCQEQRYRPKMAGDEKQHNQRGKKSRRQYGDDWRKKE